MSIQYKLSAKSGAKSYDIQSMKNSSEERKIWKEMQIV